MEQPHFEKPTVVKHYESDILPKEVEVSDEITGSLVEARGSFQQAILIEALDELANLTGVSKEWLQDLDEDEVNKLNEVLVEYQTKKIAGAALQEMLLVKKRFEQIFA